MFFYASLYFLIVLGVSFYISPKNFILAIISLLIAYRAIIDRAIIRSASQFHEKWRKAWKKQNHGDQPRWKEGDTKGIFDVDINQPFHKLPHKWQFENLEASKVAINALYRFFGNKERFYS